MKQSLFSYIKERFINTKSISIILTIYSIFCFISCIYSFVSGEIRNGLLSLLFLTFPFLFYLVEYLFKIKISLLFTIILFIICAGSILGSCYNFYTIIPFLDTILHGMSGFIFPCLGFVLMELFIGKPNNKKTFFACLVFAISFSLAISVIWEIFEYTGTMLLGFDMMEDTYINGFNSYLLSGDHNVSFPVNDIDKTVIYYGNNQILTIDGYMDIGLIDTLNDMIIHFVMTIIFTIVTIISYFKCPKINELLIPSLTKKEESN